MDAPISSGRVLAVGASGGPAAGLVDADPADAGLADAGLTVVPADDAGAVREVVEAGTVDCVVADRDAVPSARNLLEDVHGLDDCLPVVLLGDDPEAAVPPATLVDVAAYLRDPDVARVVAAVRRAVERSRRRRDRRLAAEAGAAACVVRGGAVSYATPALADLLGRARGDVEGAPAVELAVPDDRASLADRLDAAAPGDDVGLEFAAAHADGDRVVVDSRWTAVGRSGADADDAVGAVVGSLSDVTARADRAAELCRNSEMLGSLLENVPMSVYFKDRLGRHERVSDHLVVTDPEEYIKNDEGKIHVHPADVVGKTDYDLYAPEFAAQTVADDHRVMETEEALVDKIEEGTTNLGETQFTATTKAPRYDEDGNVIGLVGVTVDVTDREEHKRELQRQNERLNEFAEVLTHDLRNPLNIAKGHLEVLEEGHDPGAVEASSDALVRMEQIVEEIRAFVLHGRTVADPGAVELREAALSAWRGVDTADATLRVDTELVLEADADRLQRALENLFRNAVEHGGDGVTVTVGTLDTGRGFYVADDGPGVPVDVSEQIFERGYTTGEGGTGFGLAIVEDIAEAHGWEVRLADDGAQRHDGGARFEFDGVVRMEPMLGRTIQ